MNIINLGNRIVNNYILPIGGRYLLVDTGYKNNINTFLKKLDKNNIQLNDIAYIFLTHAHDDHAGFLNELLYQTSAKIILHSLAIEILRQGQNSFAGGCSTKLALIFCKSMALVGKGEHRFPPVESKFENRFITLDSQNIKSIENELSIKIIETPGHTSCSISLLLDNGILFCGDAAMNGFPSLRKATIWIEDLNCFYRSWETIISLNPITIYPGHGKPFSTYDLKKYLSNIKKLYPLSSDK